MGAIFQRGAKMFDSWLAAFHIQGGGFKEDISFRRLQPITDVLQPAGLTSRQVASAKQSIQL